jgi:hypothetical protein
MGWSDSPTSGTEHGETGMSQRVAGSRTLEHVFDEDAALDNLLVGVELFIVRSNEENHF